MDLTRTKHFGHDLEAARVFAARFANAILHRAWNNTDLGRRSVYYVAPRHRDALHVLPTRNAGNRYAALVQYVCSGCGHWQSLNDSPAADCACAGECTRCGTRGRSDQLGCPGH